ATGDSAVARAGEPTTIDVLSNDTSPNNQPLTVKRVWGAQKGEVRVNPDNTVTYTARPGEMGTDEFMYRAVDNHGRGKNANVVVTLAEPNRQDRQMTVVVPPPPPPPPVILPPVVVHATPEPPPPP